MKRVVDSRGPMTSYRAAWLIFASLLALWLMVAPSNSDGGWYDVLPVIALLALAWAVISRTRIRRDL